MAEQSSSPGRTGRHKPSGDNRLGLIFALGTVLCWSTLPAALKITLVQLDPWTLTWFRFLIALLIGGGIVFAAGRHAEFRRLDRGGWVLLGVATLCLTINYVAYLLGLDLTTPANSQVIIQLAPVLMAVGGLVVFGERYSRSQWVGFALLLAGLALFFNDQIQVMWAQKDAYLLGTGFIVLAAVVWAAYALAQKQLLRDIGGQTVMAFIYLFATLALLPTARAGALVQLDTVGWLALWFCALNTLGAYGAFTAALRHWDASRVSAVLAVVPLGTVAVGAIAARLWPQWIDAESIGPLGWAGAILVMTGSMTTSLLGGRSRREGGNES